MTLKSIPDPACIFTSAASHVLRVAWNMTTQFRQNKSKTDHEHNFNPKSKKRFVFVLVPRHGRIRGKLAVDFTPKNTLDYYISDESIRISEMKAEQVSTTCHWILTA